MVSKFGRKFEDVSKLFDHVAHNGSNYLSDHCFVSLMLCVPVFKVKKNVIIHCDSWYEKRILRLSWMIMEIST